MRLTHSVPAAGALLVLVAAAAGFSITAPSAQQAPASPEAIVAPAAEPTLADAAILGTSGKLRAVIGLPSALSENTAIAPLLADRSIAEPGVHPLGATAPDGDELVAVALEPFTSGKSRTETGYRLGSWPSSGLAERNPNYAPPAGYIPVTRENKETALSERFHFADFLTHDQQDVWPKALVIRTKLIDKLELIADKLEEKGMSGRLHVMSGFRTPQYNEQGVGKKGGRARNSRHMYGDAADVFVDADGNGRMDDLNGDGRSTVADAKVLFAVAEEVESEHPELIGGLSAYTPTSAHGPFVHVDTRGHRARW